MSTENKNFVLISERKLKNSFFYLLFFYHERRMDKNKNHIKFNLSINYLFRKSNSKLTN